MRGRNSKRPEGFTLVELLMALAITGIILTAVATLAYAVRSADDAADDTSQKQAQLRYTTLRISELLKHSRLICAAFTDDLAVWRADDNGNGQLNMNELTYIERGSGANRVRLCEFVSGGNPVLPLSALGSLSSAWWGAYGATEKYTLLIPQCGNVQISMDTSPPNTKFVSVSFDLSENGTLHHYEISAALRSWAGHLLNASGQLVSSDDD